jgi:glycosyltransferase involved in cell wall biosynthesis
MKVVLLHDWLTGFRGGERVLEVFCEMFPQAPLYTLFYQPGSTTPTIEERKIVTSYLNNLPGISGYYRKLLPLFPSAVDLMKISEDADLILSSSHCVIKGVAKNRRAKHLCYIHSPMRYIYDQYDNYFGSHASLPVRVGGRLFRNYLTNWDIASNHNVDQFLANSKFVQQRIKRFYGLDSTVVFPFVDLDDFTKYAPQQREKSDYFLMVTAFAPNKRVDLAIEAFNQLGLPLHIVGGGQEEARLKSMAGSTISFLGNLSRQEVVEQMYAAKGFVFPGVEDFGITPLEALASSTPVISFRAGGALETLTDEVAEFFDEPSATSLVAAIKRFNQRSFQSDKLIARSKLFSKERFKANIEREIELIMGR